MTLSSHVLDGTRGRPAVGVPVRWDCLDDGRWQRVADAVTDDDGRVTDWGGASPDRGVHRVVFGTGEYFTSQQVETFYPEVVVVFEVTHPGQHHHVPLLLSPFAYSTYRGS